MARYDLEGRRALVTGGGSGIGLATARLYLENGARVALWGRDLDKLETASASLAPLGEVTIASVDVSAPDQVATGAKALLDDWGGLDILFNCAGHSVAFGPFTTLGADVWRQAMAVNLDSVFYTCQAFLPAMLEAGWGRIVNTTSQAAKDGSPQMAPYVAAKTGVIGITKSLGRELATTGVLVNAICPTVFETPLATEAAAGAPGAMEAAVAMIPMKRKGQPEEAAELVAWLSSPACSYSTGHVYDLSGGRAVY
ncbi:MAG: SDR family NAD(P)-dependent oxidoreductase [Pseudomonadota bacterium]|nr:SDR family NAD(P)-dependent oxidoreductase [Pseudomonadota bacterium]